MRKKDGEGASQDEDDSAGEESEENELEKEIVVFLIAKMTPGGLVTLSNSDMANIAIINNQLQETNFIYIVEDGEAEQKITWVNQLNLLIVKDTEDAEFFLTKLKEVKRDQSIIDNL